MEKAGARDKGVNMKEIPIPETKEEQAKKARSLNRMCTAWNVLAFVCGALALGSVIALVVVLVVFGIRGAAVSLFYALMGSFSGGALVFALLCFFLYTLGNRANNIHTDFLERCDGEESFFVGDGTLATFGDSLLLHGDGGMSSEIPYEDVRFFSVCTRRAPKEKGEWSVVIEIPAHYLAKKPQREDPPVLIQTDAKERLYRTLERHSLSLIGEMPKAESSKRAFKPLRTFSAPDVQKRRAALLPTVLGGAALIGGIFAAIFWQPATGAIIAAVGAALLIRGIVSLFRAKRTVAVYEEGLFWREENIAERLFLKWEEIDLVVCEKDGMLRIHCPYGAYRFPEQGSYPFLRERFPEKCEESKGEKR